MLTLFFFAYTFITILDLDSDFDLESLPLGSLDCDFGSLGNDVVGFDFDDNDADGRDMAGRFIGLVFGFATSHVLYKLYNIYRLFRSKESKGLKIRIVV